MIENLDKLIAKAFSFPGDDTLVATFFASPLSGDDESLVSLALNSLDDRHKDVILSHTSRRETLRSIGQRYGVSAAYIGILENESAYRIRRFIIQNKAAEAAQREFAVKGFDIVHFISDSPLVDLQLCSRTYHTLLGANIDTIGEAISGWKSGCDWYASLSKSAHAELEEKLKEYLSEVMMTAIMAI